MLRPGYKLPNRHDIGNKLLDRVYSDLQETCKERLNDKTVSMAIDGWSNIHNEPVICASITSDGQTYLSETIDTSGNKEDANYLENISKTIIENAENRYNCRVASLVTDNAANMKKMRKNLITNDGFNDIISYGCSAHSLNLLAKDRDIGTIKSQIASIMKYFRNHHYPSSIYKNNGGKKLKMPLDIRWNSVCDCLQSYIDNWPILFKVCEENRNQLLTSICNKVYYIYIIYE